MLTKTAEDFVRRRYDYLIIGGGTAGLVLGARLTEDPNVSVGILEAGSSHLDDPKIQCPGMCPNLWIDPEYDWMLKTIPQKHLNDRVLPQSRGKGLGGSSAVNIMMFTYPTQQELDDWREATGFDWSFADLAPYYRKFEGLQEQRDDFYHLTNAYDPALRHTNGPIKTSFPKEERVGDREWLQSFEGRGLKMRSDPKSGFGTGAYSLLQSVDPSNGCRSYSVTGYYQPAANRANLHVITEAHVQKITFSGSQIPKATGVVFATKNGSIFTAFCKQEVVLCAGSYLSPQILELSGIGNPEILQSHGINTIVENRDVGENLQDHFLLPLCYEVADGVTTNDSLIMNPQLAEKAMNEFWSERTGPLGTMCSSVANISYPQIKKGGLNVGERADPRNAKSFSERRESLLLNALLDDNSTAMQYIYLLNALADPENPGAPVTTQHLTLFSTLSRPLSRGSVHIASADGNVPPLIDPRYLSHPKDLQVTIDGLLWIQDFVTTQEPFASLLKGPKGQKVRQHGVPELRSRGEAEAWTRETIGTEFHPLGTCAMGKRGDGGVVDERLRVYGVTGLRIVDASVAPIMVRNNLQSLVYALAERAADMIKEDAAWKSKL